MKYFKLYDSHSDYNPDEVAKPGVAFDGEHLHFLPGDSKIDMESDPLDIQDNKLNTELD